MSTNLNHFTTSNFWQCYHNLPLKIQKIADEKYELLKNNPNHSSLKLKKIGDLYSVRVTKNYRALGINETECILWFWIGNHRKYEQILSKS